MAEEIKVPDIGENVESGKVAAVHVKAGDRIEIDDTVIELETDKAVVEIPSTAKGKVAEVLVSEGDEIKVGDVIARVEKEAADSEQAPEEDEEAAPSEKTEPEEEKPKVDEKEEAVQEADSGKKVETRKETADADEPESRSQKSGEKEADEKTPGRKEKKEDRPPAAAPSVRRLARELGVDIHAVKGGGPGNRITPDDVKSYVKNKQGTTKSGPDAPSVMGAGLPDFSRWGEIETQPLSSVRRLTAESTAASWRNVPHVTQFDEADISNLNAFIGKYADQVSSAGGKLTLTAVLTLLCAKALKKFPRFNASIDPENQQIILKKYVHIGVMVATERGLLVPVIRNADRKTITQLAVEIVDLAGRARNKKVKPDELEGGTFSISNQGGIGGVGFTPIVLWPQVAILGVSRTSNAPVYMDGRFQPRQILPLSLSYDHRILDGADAARFLRWICESLEEPLRIHLDGKP